MPDADRCSLLREKLTLAGRLVQLAEEKGHLNTRITNEALVQGAVALLGEGRNLLLQLVAGTTPAEPDGVDSLEVLQARVGGQPGEVQVLSALASEHSSWWSRLEALLARQRETGKRASRPRDEGLIAVASAGPDDSAEALRLLLSEFRNYFETFVERHDQW